MRLKYYSKCNVSQRGKCFSRCCKVIVGIIIIIAFSASGSEKKILFFGDSIAMGVGASAKNKRFSSVLSRKLNSFSDNYKEINLAVSGATLIGTSYLKILPKAIAAKPDIFVIQYGTNDNAIGHSTSKFLYFYRLTVKKIKKKLPRTKIVCMTICPSWNHYNSNSAWLNMVNTGIQEIAAEENVLLAKNFYALKNSRKLFPDRIHPNDEGHKLMAESVYKAIKKNKAPNPDRIDFIASCPGKYRIAGYIIELMPSDDTANRGWAVFKGLGSKSFVYKSDYKLKVTTPRNSFAKLPEITIKHQTKAIDVKWLATRQAYFTLPINKKYTRVTIKK